MATSGQPHHPHHAQIVIGEAAEGAAGVHVVEDQAEAGELGVKALLELPADVVRPELVGIDPAGLLEQLRGRLCGIGGALPRRDLRAKAPPRAGQGLLRLLLNKRIRLPPRDCHPCAAPQLSLRSMTA